MTGGDGSLGIRKPSMERPSAPGRPPGRRAPEPGPDPARGRRRARRPSILRPRVVPRSILATVIKPRACFSFVFLGKKKKGTHTKNEGSP